MTPMASLCGKRSLPVKWENGITFSDAKFVLGHATITHEGGRSVELNLFLRGVSGK